MNNLYFTFVFGVKIAVNWDKSLIVCCWIHERECSSAVKRKVQMFLFVVTVIFRFVGFKLEFDAEENDFRFVASRLLHLKAKSTLYM